MPDAGAAAFRQRIFRNLQRMGIDFCELVGAEFAEKWDAFAVDLDSVGASVFGWSGFQVDFSRFGIKSADHVSYLNSEPEYSLRVENWRCGGLPLLHLAFCIE